MLYRFAHSKNQSQEKVKVILHDSISQTMCSFFQVNLCLLVLWQHLLNLDHGAYCVCGFALARVASTLRRGQNPH